MRSINIQSSFLSSIKPKDVFLELDKPLSTDSSCIAFIRPVVEDQRAVKQINEAFCSPVTPLGKIFHLIQRIWDKGIALFSLKRRERMGARDLLTHPTADLTQSLQFLSEVRKILNQSDQYGPDLLRMSVETVKEEVQSLGELERKAFDTVCFKYPFARFYPSLTHRCSRFSGSFSNGSKKRPNLSASLKHCRNGSI